MAAVLFVSHDGSPTGAPIFLLRFLRWFREHRQIPFRILVGSHGDLVTDFESVASTDCLEQKSTIFRKVGRRLKVGQWDNSQHRAALREQLRKSNISAVYANTIATGNILDFLSFLDCPVICHVHELDRVIRLLGHDNLMKVKTHASSYIAVSQAVRRNLVENHGIPEHNVQIIPEFVPTDDRQLTGSGTTVRHELRIPENTQLVCACGSIESRKGPDLFLQVAAKVGEIQRGIPVHFIWVGGTREQLRSVYEKVKPLSFRHLVHFIGRRDDVGRYYEASDVFLLPSREDPFPLVMMEAAYRRKPIVCFADSGGASEFVEQDAGFAVQGFDVKEMSARVIQLLDSPRLREEMGASGRQKVLDRHDLEISAPRITTVIEQAMRSYKAD
jgi:glycosyltransferase involved in cell wall biosynthesis